MRRCCASGCFGSMHGRVSLCVAFLWSAALQNQRALVVKICILEATTCGFHSCPNRAGHVCHNHAPARYDTTLWMNSALLLAFTAKPSFVELSLLMDLTYQHPNLHKSIAYQRMRCQLLRMSAHSTVDAADSNHVVMRGSQEWTTWQKLPKEVPFPAGCFTFVQEGW